jgi:hypothetical protein
LTTTEPPVPADLPAPVIALEPGFYTKCAFLPKVSFWIGEGWTAVQSTTGFFDIQDNPGSPDVVAVQFGNVAGANTAAEAAASVDAKENLLILDRYRVKVDQYRGIYMLVETTDPLDTTPPVFHPVIDLTPGVISIASARRLELTLLNVDGGVLAMMLGGSIAEWDHALEMGGPVMGSVQIGE